MMLKKYLGLDIFPLWHWATCQLVSFCILVGCPISLPMYPNQRLSQTLKGTEGVCTNNLATLDYKVHEPYQKPKPHSNKLITLLLRITGKLSKK